MESSQKYLFANKNNEYNMIHFYSAYSSKLLLQGDLRLLT